MNKKTLAAITIAFTLGFGICYGVNASSAPSGEETTSPVVGLTSEESVAMENSMVSLADSLADKKGTDLDLAFMEAMITHHEGAVVMAEKIVTTTKRPELTEMAENIISTQRAEIETMNGWLNAWYGR
jgi:uncharacterized protein (DUF305 family)